MRPRLCGCQRLWQSRSAEEDPLRGSGAVRAQRAYFFALTPPVAALFSVLDQESRTWSAQFL